VHVPHTERDDILIPRSRILETDAGDIKMAIKQSQKEKRRADAYLDRRSGEDRRQVHNLDFFAAGGRERRKELGRRDAEERRKNCIRISPWSSVCVGDEDGAANDA